MAPNSPHVDFGKNRHGCAQLAWLSENRTLHAISRPSSYRALFLRTFVPVTPYRKRFRPSTSPQILAGFFGKTRNQKTKPKKQVPKQHHNTVYSHPLPGFGSLLARLETTPGTRLTKQYLRTLTLAVSLVISVFELCRRSTSHSSLSTMLAETPTWSRSASRPKAANATCYCRAYTRPFEYQRLLKAHSILFKKSYSLLF